MSRCFPFPPLGYEKKPRNSSEQGEDLLAKEKRKEKKHKKEKKDKEQREDKERKDKDRSKDKNKEKKDRKEKHKDKKKDDDREKDKSKTSEDQRTDHQSEIRHEGRLGYDSRKAEEVGDSKFAEELGRRIRDDEQVAANRMVEDFSATVHGRTESMGASTAVGKERTTGNKMVTDVTSTLPRRDKTLAPAFQKRAEGMEAATALEKQKVANCTKVPDVTSTVRRSENVTPPMQKRTESMVTTTVLEKQRAASNQKVEDFSPAEQRNNATGHPMENLSGSVKGKIEGVFTVNSMQKGRITSNNAVPNPVGAAMKRRDGMIKSVESPGSAGTESMSVAPPMKKEKSVFPNSVLTEERRVGMGLPAEKDRLVEKDTGKKREEREKSKEKKAEDGKREGHRDKDRSEKKRKEKDKDRHREKKKEEKRREKGEHKHPKHDKVRENGMKDQMDSLNNKTLPHIENVETANADGNSKKRKELEINGFLHEPQHDGRPNKLPRTTASSSHFPVENEKLNSHISSPSSSIKIAASCSSIKIGAINNVKVERGLDNNGSHINGKVEVQPSHALGSSVPPVALDLSKSDYVPPKLSCPPAAVESSHALGFFTPPVAIDSSKGDHVLSKLPWPPAVESAHALASFVPPVGLASRKGDHVPPKLPCPPAAGESLPALGSSVPPGALDSSKSDQAPPKLPRPPVAVESRKTDKVPSRPPHPDAKYLSAIYSVPKIEELVELEDDQEWLFSAEKPQPKLKLEVDGTPPQVWAKGLQIEAADVFALPYVVPF